MTHLQQHEKQHGQKKKQNSTLLAKSPHVFKDPQNSLVSRSQR